MRRFHWASRGALTTLLFLALAAGAAQGDDDPLQRAADLRDASVVDWEAKRYDDAVEKLKQADAIYASLDGAPMADRAKTLRALVWNEYLAGQLDACATTFARLVDMVKDASDYHFEVESAWDAIFKAAQSKPDFDAAEVFLNTARDTAKDAGMDRLAAQITHSTASVASGKSQYDSALAYLEDAIRQRKALGDHVGLTWSMNNLANLYLVNMNDLPNGMASVVAAHAMVHKERALEPQGAVAWNVRKALELAHAYEGTLDPILAGVDTMIANAAASDAGEMVSLPWLYRERLALTVGTGDAKKIQKAATALMKVRLDGLPTEARTDLVIAAAEALIGAGKGSKAKSALAKAQCGDGPASAHVEARLETVRALAAADAKKKSAFVKHANAAAAQWQALEDWQGERTALAAITEAATKRVYAEDIADVVAHWETIRTKGSPGGAGGSATSSGNRDAYQHLGPSDALFEVSFEADKLVLKDRAAGQRQEYDVQWTPRNVGVNGLALQVFGGYIVVKSLSYGGAAVSAGAPGAVKLADLGDYLPVPASGVLVIQKNGAVRYRLR